MTNDSSNTELPNKLPPQNIEAEQCLLGCLLLDKNAVVKVADFLKPRDFYNKSHQDIYQCSLDLFEKGEPIDLLSLSNRLKEKTQLEEIGGNSYLTELINSVPTASNVFSYAKIVQQKRILRDLISVSHEIGVLGYNETEDTDILLDEAEKKIFSIAQKSLTQNFVPVKATLEDAFERIDRLSKHKENIRGLATGFIGLDNILAGLQKSDLLILASRPSLGKSTLALNIAAHIAINQKEPVGIFSLEMSRDQIVDRLIASTANVDLWRLRTGRLSDSGDDNDFSRIQQALGVLSEAPIYIDDAVSANVLQMKAMSRRLQANKGLGLIIVDYLQLMESRDFRINMVQQMSEISRSLKGLARELNVPVLALSQLSRAVEQRSPQIPRLSDLRESGCLTGDTLIIKTDTGERIPIKELAERKNQTPVEILSIEDAYKLKSHKMIKVFPSGKKMVFELKTRSGRKIKASANHPFFKLDGWRRLDELKVNDFIALPRKIKIKKSLNLLSENELILLAHLLGDGCILPNQPFHYTNGEKENIQTVKKAAKELFNITGKIVKQKNWEHIYLTSPYQLARGKYHPITNWFKKLGIKRVRSWQKQIPQAVFQCDKNKISLFLRHLWATDGNLSWKYLKARKPTGNIYYSSSSEVLAEQVQHLLLRLDIQSSLRGIKSKKGYRTMYHVYVEGANEQLKFLNKVGINGKRKKIIPSLIASLEKITTNTNVDIIPKIAWKIVIEPVKQEVGIGWREVAERLDMSYCGSTLFKHGISRERMLRLCLALEENSTIRNLADSDIFWDKIVSIKPLGMQEVYDATVEGAHNFIANDVIVHNSLEQDADVVLFIHREDRYRQNSSRKNIADIIVAKHRNGPIGKTELYFDDRTVLFRNLEKGYQDEE
ncbi:replicative DNA helicase [Candidatus Parcubacteria bacterium]|nr:replicative DNA helicase [Candidatus Parcubacteria bacterium]